MNPVVGPSGNGLFAPYLTDDPVIGISTGEYIKNMGVLIEALGA